MRIVVIGMGKKFYDVTLDLARSHGEICAITSDKTIQKQLISRSIKTLHANLGRTAFLNDFTIEREDIIVLCLEKDSAIKSVLTGLHLSDLPNPVLVLSSADLDMLRKDFPYVNFAEYHNIIMDEVAEAFDKKITLSRLNTIRKLLSPEDKLLVLIAPDPDSIASALALKRILQDQVGSVTITPVQKITRLENIAMVDLLKINLVPFDQIDLDDFGRKALVDGQPNQFDLAEGFHCDIIIDHHPRVKGFSASFRDIRPSFGATSTIMFEYLDAAGITISSQLATALAYGIKTDTDAFERDTRLEDVYAFRQVYALANKTTLKRIERSVMPLSMLADFNHALTSMRFYRNRVITYLGEIESADICVIIADFFNRVREVAWCFVAACVDDKLIIVIRSDGYRKDAGRLAERSFGDIGSAGGHKSAARAEIPLETLRKVIKNFDDETIGRFIRRRIRK